MYKIFLSVIVLFFLCNSCKDCPEPQTFNLDEEMKQWLCYNAGDKVYFKKIGDSIVQDSVCIFEIIQNENVIYGEHSGMSMGEECYSEVRNYTEEQHISGENIVNTDEAFTYSFNGRYKMIFYLGTSTQSVYNGLSSDTIQNMVYNDLLKLEVTWENFIETYAIFNETEFVFSKQHGIIRFFSNGYMFERIENE